MNVHRICFVALLLSFTVPAAYGRDWFVRPDGGTRYSANVPDGQCDGKADAPYPGHGANQHCAFNDFRYMWDDGTNGSTDKGSNWGWVIAGGDTVVIRGCHPSSHQKNPSEPHCRIGWDDNSGNSTGNPWCWYAPGNYGSNFGCYNPPIPPGTAAQPTRLLGGCAYGTYRCHPVSSYPYTNGNLTQLFGGFGTQIVLNLSSTHDVDVDGLEITEHNGQCTQYGSPAYPKGCTSSIPKADDFSNNGIRTDEKTAQVKLQDVYVHGFTANGLYGPIGGPITMTRVFVGFNGFAGWNFNDPSNTPDAPGSSITASYVTMEGNGCTEQFPVPNVQFPALACYDDNSNGFGDAWSGQDTALASFTCDHCANLYNTKDGFIGPHAQIHSLKITNSESIGNMGQQWKWGAAPGSTVVFENNLTIGDCGRMSEAMPGAAPGFNRHLSDYCRAAGDIFSFYTAPDSKVLFANNTMTGDSATMFDLSCHPARACASASMTFRNNIVLGYVSPRGTGGRPPGLFYFSDPSVKVDSDHDLFFDLRSRPCSALGGAGLICDSPAFVNQPVRLTSESDFDHFDFHPQNRSPAVGHGQSVSGITLDFFGAPRPNPPSIGAVEPHR